MPLILETWRYLLFGLVALYGIMEHWSGDCTVTKGLLIFQLDKSYTGLQTLGGETVSNQDFKLHTYIIYSSVHCILITFSLHILADESLFLVLALLCAFAVFTSLYGLSYQVHSCSYMLSTTTMSFLLYKGRPITPYIDGSVQERRNSIVNALELCPSRTNPSTCTSPGVQIRQWVLVPCMGVLISITWVS